MRSASGTGRQSRGAVSAITASLDAGGAGWSYSLVYSGWPYGGGEMSQTKEERIQAANKAWEDAFEDGAYFDHKPTVEELFDLRILAVYDAGVKEGESHDKKA